MRHQILCARPAPLWRAGVLDGVECVEGPADDGVWSWGADPDSFEGLFCSTLPENLDQFTNLRWVQIDSAGFSQLIPANLPQRGIVATNAAGVFDVPIGEWCLAMMVALARDLPGMLCNQRDAVWERDARFQKEIRGGTVGFWGYGGLARETARLSHAFGLEVHVLARGALRKREEVFVLPGTGDPDGTLPDRVFPAAEWEVFLEGLDYLVMALPLTDGTRGICREQHLRTLRPSAFLLNPARGPLIEESDLVKALREGWFAGAALDTHYAYPLPQTHPLWTMPNVILTPHISGSTGSPGFGARIREIFSQNLTRLVENRPLLNRIPEGDLIPRVA